MTLGYAYAHVYSSVLLSFSPSHYYSILSIRVLLYILYPHDPLYISERRREISHLLYSFSQWNDSYIPRFVVKSIASQLVCSSRTLLSSIPSQLLRFRMSFTGIAKTLKNGCLSPSKPPNLLNFLNSAPSKRYYSRSGSAVETSSGASELNAFWTTLARAWGSVPSSICGALDYSVPEKCS